MHAPLIRPPKEAAFRARAISTICSMGIFLSFPFFCMLCWPTLRGKGDDGAEKKKSLPGAANRSGGGRGRKLGSPWQLLSDHIVSPIPGISIIGGGKEGGCRQKSDRLFFLLPQKLARFVALSFFPSLFLPLPPAPWKKGAGRLTFSSENHRLHFCFFTFLKSLVAKCSGSLFGDFLLYASHHRRHFIFPIESKLQGRGGRKRSQSC